MVLFERAVPIAVVQFSNGEETLSFRSDRAMDTDSWLIPNGVGRDQAHSYVEWIQT